MRSGEKGFALVLILIFSAVGALMLVPALKLSYTTLNLKQLRTAVLQDQYARDGGAEHAMWKLQYGGGTGELTEASQTIDYTLVLNGISTDVTIQLRAEPGLSGQALASADFKVQPQKSVIPLDPTPSTLTTFTYTITMQQLDPDPLTGQVVEVWDQLPPGFTYVASSTVPPWLQPPTYKACHRAPLHATPRGPGGRDERGPFGGGSWLTGWGGPAPPTAVSWDPGRAQDETQG